MRPDTPPQGKASRLMNKYNCIEIRTLYMYRIACKQAGNIFACYVSVETLYTELVFHKLNQFVLQFTRQM